MTAALNIDNAYILGGNGKMAGLLKRYLPSNTKSIDIGTLTSTSSEAKERIVRRISSSELKSISKRQLEKSGISSVYILSIPNSVYMNALEAPGKSRLSKLLGISGRGHSSTLFMHQTSIHYPAAKILDNISGPVFGVHMLHGPTVTDLENQTVVITSTPLKARHHKYQEGFTIIRQLKKNMGYKNIFHMTPDRHDKIMSNIQFLTHSMLLTLGGAIMNNGYQVDSNNIDSIKSDIIVLLNRMKNQPSHVYKGIAEGNIFNAGVVYALQKIVDQLPNEMCFDESLGFFREFVNKNNLQLGINNKERRQISTPMSRARDGIILKSTDMKDDYKVDLKSSLINYLQALNNNGYETYFSEIMCQVDEQLQRSNCYFNDAKVIRRYGEIILNK